MYGFVYIWRDRLKKMYYVGSHVGDPGDGYVASSAWFRSAYEKRPKDFKRRILVILETGTRRDLYIEEQRWLSMIQPCEVKVRYYNLKLIADGGNGGALRGYKFSPAQLANRPKTLSEDHKLKLSVIGRGRPHTETHRLNIAKALTGRLTSDEHRRNLSLSLKGKARPNGPKHHSQATRDRMSASGTRAWAKRKGIET